MSEVDPEGGRDAPEEALPPDVDEPGAGQPEADTLEQQLPEGGEETTPEEESEGMSPDVNEADEVEQERAVEVDRDDYRE